VSASEECKILHCGVSFASVRASYFMLEHARTVLEQCTSTCPAFVSLDELHSGILAQIVFPDENADGSVPDSEQSKYITLIQHLALWI
jgi:hypothetical protein